MVESISCGSLWALLASPARMTSSWGQSTFNDWSMWRLLWVTHSSRILDRIGWGWNYITVSPFPAFFTMPPLIFTSGAPINRLLSCKSLLLKDWPEASIMSPARWLSEERDMFWSVTHEANEKFFQKDFQSIPGMLRFAVRCYLYCISPPSSLPVKSKSFC